MCEGTVCWETPLTQAMVGDLDPVWNAACELDFWQTPFWNLCEALIFRNKQTNKTHSVAHLLLSQ